MPPPLLELRKIVKIYDGKTVLDGIDLAVERGETVVVLGGSGSGKSTLARIIVGLEPPTEGQILLDGEELASLDEASGGRAPLAMVFQGHALLDGMTVFDNVAFPLREREHLAEDAIAERVNAQLDALGLADAAQKLPGELSGGMAKRVGIARAMVMGPELLVYDEPTSGLDPVTSRTVDDLIEELRERHGVTSIVITHDMATAYGVADRVILLDKGKIAADGDPEAVFRSEESRVKPFAASSGVDPSRLGHRSDRPTPEEIRGRSEPHREPEPQRRSWIERLMDGS